MESWKKTRPINYYDDCVGRPRPCPWFGCKHHLLLDVNPSSGTITLNIGRTTKPGGHRGRQITDSRRASVIPSRRGEGSEAMADGEAKLFKEFDTIRATDSRPTCVLDCVSGETNYTLEEIGDIMSLTRERVRQIESNASRKLRSTAGREGYEEWMNPRKT